MSEALEVRLAPADIRLRPPSAEELHSDVAELIERGEAQHTRGGAGRRSRSCEKEQSD